MSKTFGRCKFYPEADKWVIDPIEPHAIIRMKSIFRKIDKTRTAPFVFPNSPEVCHELEWFFQRYPLDITPEDEKTLLGQKSLHLINLSELERLMKSDYVPREFKINGEPRHYQSVATELYLRNKILLVGDDVGLGKTLIAILSFLDMRTLPALVVVQTHLPPQWKAMIEKFVPGIKVHMIKGTRPYPLPPADVYIMKYSCLAGWSDVYGTGVFKSAVFDEVQELRISGSQKYHGAENLVKAVEYVLGLSATPIYNFGDEIYAILNLMKQGCLGGWGEFTREWCTNYGQHWKVDEPQALGTHLREQFLFLRRTRADVNREMPIVNKIVHTVEFDEGAVKGIEDLARKLAIRVTTGSFVERGQAARELDIMVRHATGVSKAKYVAEYVKILLSNGEPVLLAGWHRDVYDIWLKEFKAYHDDVVMKTGKPAPHLKAVMYTGSESPTEKEKAKQAFISGEAGLMIISLRSGIGLDGLQARCNVVVFGELDWSPSVHHQVTGRVDRDGQQQPVTSIYLVSNSGSDPLIVDLLGLKASQAQGIIDPLATAQATHSDESRIKLLAEKYLAGRST